MRACCWSDLDEGAADETAGPKKGNDNDDIAAAPVVTTGATPEDDGEDDDCDEAEMIVVRLTRVPIWKRVLFLMSKRKLLMSQSLQTTTLMSHQPFIISRE